MQQTVGANHHVLHAEQQKARLMHPNGRHVKDIAGDHLVSVKTHRRDAPQCYEQSRAVAYPVKRALNAAGALFIGNGLQHAALVTNGNDDQWNKSQPAPVQPMRQYKTDAF